MRVFCIGRTNKGEYRDNNEDNIYLDGNYVTDPSMDEMILKGNSNHFNHTAAICDGIGGAAHGEAASLTAVKALRECDKGFEYEDLTCWLEECIDKMNNAVNAERQDRRASGMGSTVALIHTEGGKAWYANVGDSRIYFFRSGEIKQLSVDHTRRQMMLDAGIEADNLVDAAEHQLTQNLGIPKDEFVIEPACGCLDLKPGDVMLLCSDGLTDVLGEENLRDIITKHTPTDEEVLDRLFTTAFEYDAKDNISAILFEVTE